MKKWAFLDSNEVIQFIAEGDIHTNTFTSEVDITSYSGAVEVLDYRGEALIGKKWNGITDKFE